MVGGRAALAAVATAFLSTAALGAPDEVRALTLHEAEEIAAKGPAVSAALAAADEAHAAVGTAWSFDDPAVSLGTSRHSAKRIVGVTVAVPPVWESAPAAAAARAGWRAAGQRAAASRLDARVAADVAWLDLWRAEQLAALAAASRDDAERMSSAAEERFTSGDVPRQDVVQSRAELALARAAAAGANADRAGAASSLAAFLGFDPALPLATAGNPPPPPAALPTTDDVLRAAGASPDARAEEQEIRSAKWGYRAAVLGWIPRAAVEVTREEGDPGLPGPDLTVIGTLQIPLGLGHGPAMRSASAALRRTEAESAVAFRARAGEALRALRVAEGARAKLVALDGDAVPAAVEAATLAEEAYRAGEIGLIEWITARHGSIAVQIERANVMVDATVAQSDLERAMGTR